jgi:predicted nucleic acid-binding protein
MDKPTLYIETSIVSYLAADPSRHPVTLRNQQLTHTWWNTRRHDYALFTSPLTRVEVARGEPRMSRRRLALLAPIASVQSPPAAAEIARMLHEGIPLPERAEPDAQHIAFAAVNGLDFLLTWDRSHIANPRLRLRIESILAKCGYTPPVFCTPDDLMR